MLLKESIAANKNNISACLQTDVTVVCVSRETGNNKFMPFRALYEHNNKFWLRNENWEYFLSNDDFAKVQEAASKMGPRWEPSAVRPDESGTKETDESFGKGYQTIASMTEIERIKHITEDKNRLASLIAQKPRQERLVTEALVETAQNAMLHNHAALVNVMALSNDEAKKQTQSLVDSTRDLVKATSQLISDNIFNDELMNTLVAKSNGTIIQHMTRTYLNGLAFLSYYNKLVSSSSMITKLRISLDDRHRHFYQSLLPHEYLEDIILEKVFLGGMRKVTENNFYNWATGFLIHDIGKAGAVEYHEGEAAYDRDIVVEHVKVGYTAIDNKTNYPKEAALITGYHHEYYGDPAGYGYFRSYLDEYKKLNPQATQGYCITYDLEPMLDYEALSYFPAKVLEIIDVFDSVTDPNRKYHKALSTEDAIDMMQEEFVNQHHKIDMILFDIFTGFIKEKLAS